MYQHARPRPLLLIVNDTEDMLEMLSAMLAKEGYDILTARDGREGIETALASDPDLVISDVLMPEVDGLELVRTLKQDPRTSATPILLTSALLRSASDSLTGLETGADDYLGLPMRMEELRVKVARLAERSRVERSYRDIIENASDMIYTCDADGRLTGINKAGARLLGAPAEKLLGKRLGEVARIEHRGEDRDDDSDCEPEPRKPLRSVLEIRDATGERFLEAVMSPVLDPHAQVAGYRGIARDLTERKRSEEALRSSEERHRLLFESNPLPMWVYDLETLDFLQVNNAAVRDYGYSRDEFLSMTIKDIRPPEAVKELVETVKHGFGRLGTVSLWQHLKKNGSLIDVEVTSHELPFGERPARLVLASDVTSRLAAERALRESERKHRDLFENAHDLIHSVAPDGRLLYANRAWRETLGYTPAEIARLSFLDIVAPGCRAYCMEIFERAMTGVQVDGIAATLIAKDAREVMVEGGCSSYVEDGKIAALQCILRDVTEQKRAEGERLRLQNRIQRSAAEWQTTFDAIGFPVLVLSVAGEITRVNKAAMELAGEDYARLVGRRIEAVDPGQPWQRLAELAAAIRKGEPAAASQVTDADGKTWSITAGADADHDGGGAHLILTARDVTERVAMEASLRRSEMMSMMGALVAGVAHEVRNPLFAITSIIDAFEARFGAQTEYNRYITVLRTELERLAELMNELLEYGKPYSLELHRDGLERIVEQAVRSCQPLAKQMGVAIVNECEAAAASVVSMDRRRLPKVFSNLLENAIRHSPIGGEVFVRIGEETDDGRRRVRCTIEDSGSGFKEEELCKVFEPFFSKRRGGTGLGLSIVQRIVEEHGGEVRAGNRPQGGARVTVVLPSADDAALTGAAAMDGRESR